MAAPSWSGRKVTAAREMVAAWLPMQCGRCPRIVDGTEPWVVGHKVSRALRPDLMWNVDNWQPEHRTCSDASAQAAVIEKARAEGARAALSDFPDESGAGQPPHLPNSLPGATEDLWDLRYALTWAHHVENAPEWLQPYLEVPGDASPPLAMTPVHPAAVGSYGAQAIEWIETRRRLTLRWWQRLAIVRQLEHDADGGLCWPVVVESGSRRIGKSERLRSIALWRMEHGVGLFEPGQIVVHVGRDLAVVREVQQRVWSWCEAQEWEVTRGNGKEAVTHPNGARWLAKAMHSAYGFDVHLGLADECWDVDPGAISEGIEPATLDRESAQLVLTSTSHRKATSLMKRRIAAALAADDDRTLLLLWGVAPDADIYAEETWKAASAYWTPERRDHIASKLAEAQEAGPELDDPDPVGSWAHQYLNRWDLTVRRKEAKGEAVVSEKAWADLAQPVGVSTPDAAAIESWFGRGVSLVLAWRVDDRVVVSVSDHAELDAAVDALKATGYRGRAVLGTSLMTDPAARRIQRTKGEARTGAAVHDLQRLLAEDLVRHDGGAHLTGQVLAVRTLPGADGPRMASTERADAVKAAVWAVRAARARVGKPRVVLASS